MTLSASPANDLAKPSAHSAKKYKVNEIFFSLQGEGIRSGTANIFIRFSDCNLRCVREKEGFDCDTEFMSGRELTADEILSEVKSLSADCRWIILTGGEPSLQIDDSFLDLLHEAHYQIAIETNGLREISSKVDWICVSPKTAEHTLKQRSANEVKYIRRHGMALPQTTMKADHYLISPAFDGDQLTPETLEWCIQLVKNNPVSNPPWRLSIQTHKWLRIR